MWQKMWGDEEGTKAEQEGILWAPNSDSTSGVAWVIGARGGLQFCRPQKVSRCLLPPYHAHFAATSWSPPLATPAGPYIESNQNSITQNIRQLGQKCVGYVSVQFSVYRGRWPKKRKPVRDGKACQERLIFMGHPVLSRKACGEHVLMT